MKRKNKKKKMIAGILVILLVAAGVTVWIKMRSGQDKVNAGASTQTTVRLSKMDLVESISATGTFSSANSKDVSAAVNNIEVKKVLVSVGDTVKQGDALVRFDESDLKDALTEAKENLSDVTASANREVTNAQTQLSNAQATYSDNKTSVEKEIASAKKNLTEIKKSIKQTKAKIKKAKTEQEKTSLQQQLTQLEEKLEQAQNSYDSAQSNRTSQTRQNQSDIENAKDSLEQAKSNRTKQIKEAKKQVELAQNNLEQCAVTAPIDGTVTSLSVEDGDTYSGGTMLQIQDTESLVVTTSVDEYDISDVKTGQEVVILTEATDDDQLEGEIAFVAPTTGSGSTSSSQMGGEGSGSSSDGYEVQIKVTSKDDRIKIGMTAKCSIIKEKVSDVFAVPYDAVHTSGGESFIYVIDGDSSSEVSGEFQRPDRDSENDSDESSDDDSEKGFGKGSGRDFGNGPVDDSDSNADTADTSTQRKITVTTGMESDYYIEVQSDELQEGMQVLIPTDQIDSSSDDSSGQNNIGFGGLGGNMGGPGQGSENINRGNRGDRSNGGGAPGGPGAP